MSASEGRRVRLIEMLKEEMSSVLEQTEKFEPADTQDGCATAKVIKPLN